jgi:hypothetical protein
MPALRTFLTAFLFCALLAFATPVSAAENPLAVPNNKIGIHILDVSELPEAAQLINNNGGAWGYVTIPIQAGDQNRAKWQTFMDNCKKYQVIPILRLATGDDSSDTNAWRKPTIYDVINFANFLNSLDWPTKNRYIVLFNEVNRGDEWGGSANAAEYAKLLSFADTIFKSANPDFFIISAGLDDAAPNQGTTYVNEYTYLTEMNQAVPGIFNQIDGMASHSYPNPGFSQPPDSVSLTGVGSFIHERTLVESMSNKVLPVFITETGWSMLSVNDTQSAQYYDKAFQTIWNDPDIVAITPFVLSADMGPFEQFSFIKKNGVKTKEYQYIFDMKKTKGVPSLPTHVLADRVKNTTVNTLVAAESSNYEPPRQLFSLNLAFRNILNYFLHR